LFRLVAKSKLGAPSAAKDASMTDYEIQARETVAEVPGLRVRMLTLAQGQCVPWHYHSEITDTFFCMQGPLRVETRAPRAEFILQPGESFAVPPMTAHYVSGVDHMPAKFMIVQGEGTYDYVPVGGER
jgi:quercetin dioxygenase-like cupin family protein